LKKCCDTKSFKAGFAEIEARADSIVPRFKAAQARTERKPGIAGRNSLRKRRASLKTPPK
jgi:hypothetical protein